MKIAVDRNMPLAPEAFRTLGDVSIVDGRTLSPSEIQDTTLLAIRSTTKVNAALLEGTSVQFVGTATIGTDHLDIPYLEERGIQWMYSPGCNAQSVAEYITAALLHLAIRYMTQLEGKTLGIIGVGNVGKRVAKQAEALGMRVLLHDPPRARREENHIFCALDQILAESDFITMHVPLTKEGPDATFHMAGQTFFSKMKPGAFFLNAARGAIVDTPALLAALDKAHLSAAVIDTWEGEPSISLPLLERATIATPHIAGHSFEGKANGTIMVYEAACRFLKETPVFMPAPHMPAPLLPETECPQEGDSLEKLNKLVCRVYNILDDDRRLRAAKNDPAGFDNLRRNYPIRREFACTSVSGIGDAALAHQIRQVGFTVSAAQ